ncbi:hypothetical protein [Candidatus Solirubrobacter pratensis]|uniref:hypothetical protein n=1 Tax=Candidatus Solirubrobacter pratensis TaxID=1298857 RepID=UPI0004182493
MIAVVEMARVMATRHFDATIGMDVQVIHRRDRYLRGGDHIPFLERGYAAARFTQPDATNEHQHQDVRVQDGCSTAICRSTSTSTTSPASRA